MARIRRGASGRITKVNLKTSEEYCGKYFGIAENILLVFECGFHRKEILNTDLVSKRSRAGVLKTRDPESY